MSLFDQLNAGRPLREHISPEGVEEQILYEERFIVTRTMGGKFRVYRISNNSQSSRGVAETLMKAGAILAECILTHGYVLSLLFSDDRKKQKKP